MGVGGSGNVGGAFCGFIIGSYLHCSAVRYICVEGRQGGEGVGAFQ